MINDQSLGPALRANGVPSENYADGRETPLQSGSGLVAFFQQIRVASPPLEKSGPMFSEDVDSVSCRRGALTQ